jgi:hypothetical protein
LGTACHFRIVIGRKNISRLVALDDRCSPKAKVTRSNRVGCATSEQN